MRLDNTFLSPRGNSNLWCRVECEQVIFTSFGMKISLNMVCCHDTQWKIFLTLVYLFVSQTGPVLFIVSF